MSEENIKKYEEEDREQNKKIAWYITGGMVLAVLAGLLAMNFISLDVVKKKANNLEMQIEQLQENNTEMRTALENMQIEYANIQNELAKAELEIDTRDEEIAVYKDSLEDIGIAADEISEYINNIREILGLEALD